MHPTWPAQARSPQAEFAKDPAAFGSFPLVWRFRLPINYSASYNLPKLSPLRCLHYSSFTLSISVISTDILLPSFLILGTSWLSSLFIIRRLSILLTYRWNKALISLIFSLSIFYFMKFYCYLYHLLLLILGSICSTFSISLQ